MMKSVHSPTASYDPYTKATFQALVDAFVPPTPKLAVKHGPEQGPGAVDLHVDEYVIWELDHYLWLQGNLAPMTVPLSVPTAGLLNSAAIRLIETGRVMNPQNPSYFPGAGPFASLSRRDRLRAISLLEELDIDLSTLPVPYQNNAGFVKSMADALNRMPLFGFYSEWSGYGTTRLAPPDLRRLEFFPLSWKQVGYPGAVPGYRDFRGFLLIMPRGENSGV